MTADEIRERFGKSSACLELDIQTEICAQLAELNESMRSLQWYMEEIQEGRMVITTKKDNKL